MNLVVPGLYAEIVQRGAELAVFQKEGGGGGGQLQAVSGGTHWKTMWSPTAHKTVQPLMPYEDCYRGTRRTL